MENVDTQELNNYDEDTGFLCEMCGDDHELLFLDSYLRDTFRGHGVYVRHEGDEVFVNENTV